MRSDTIYAPATGEVKAALSVVRISGAEAHAIVDQLTAKPTPLREAAVRKLFDPKDGQQIDEAVVLRFERPASFTGEDVVELHVHGGASVRSKLYTALEQLGARLARPGEFTFRRFDAGLFDASQAEAVASLVDAETEAQRILALRLLDGELGRRASSWRSVLIEALALLEAGLDFAEEDVGAETEQRSAVLLEDLAKEFRAELKAVSFDQAALSTPVVTIIGPPNAGKSTLLNRLVEEDLAIVTPIPGATRDPIRSRLIVGDAAIELIDTAGMRETADPVEVLGVEKAESLAERASLRILVLSPDVVDQVANVRHLVRPDDIVVWNKLDLGEPPRSAFVDCATIVATQVGDAASLDTLKQIIRLRTVVDAHVVSPISGSDRRKVTFSRASQRIEAAMEMIRTRRPEAAVEEGRQALRHLEDLVGRVAQDDIYDEIFSRFCIGK